MSLLQGVFTGALKYFALLAFLLVSLRSVIQDTQAQKPSSAVPAIPRTWDAAEVATLEVPVADAHYRGN